MYAALHIKFKLSKFYLAMEIEPQATLGPAAPEGWDLKSSAPP